MVQNMFFFITGIILFLFGMLQLNATVQHNFTNIRIREYFRLATQKPAYGVLTGILSTIIFQSSSATTVLTVGMTSAGLISFYHSLGIILGADIGTTLTVQLVVWKVTKISPLFIMFGGALWILGKGNWKFIGEALFYFGMIFFGLNLVSLATEPLKNNHVFIDVFQNIRNPLWGLCVGLVITAIIQSSAATIAVLVILAQQDLISLEIALPIVFGANVGTAVTALLASLVANVEGKKCAVSHIIFKFLGVALCMIILPFIISILHNLATNTAQQISLGHFLFNLIVVVVFFPFIKPFSQFIEQIVRKKGEMLPLWPEYLNERYIRQPEKALTCVKQEITRELILAQKMFNKTVDLITRFQQQLNKDVFYIELVVDNVRDEIVDYLRRVAENPLSQTLSQQLFLFSSAADDIESIADHIINLAERSERKHNQNISFTEGAIKDLQEIIQFVSQNIDDAILIIKKRDDKIIKDIIEREAFLDIIIKEAKDKHLERYYNRLCQPEAGPIFIELLNNLERISDHCENIAEYIQDIQES